MFTRNPIILYNDDEPQGLSKFINSFGSELLENEKKLFVKAFLYQRKGDKSKAKKIYNQLLIKYPKNSILKNNLLLL